MEILEIIKNYRSKDNPISNREIQRITGYKAVDIRVEINRCRKRGEPICSCSRGYYYSNNLEDIFETMRSLSKRFESVNLAIRGLNKVILKMKEEREFKDDRK